MLTGTFKAHYRYEVEMARQWTVEELHETLARFRTELGEAGLAPSSVETYVTRSETFLRWLSGAYVPGQGLRRR